MKRTFTKKFLWLLFTCSAFQASAVLNQQPAGRDCAPSGGATSVTPASAQSVRHAQPKNQTQAIFDIQFNFPMSFASGVSCVYTGTEFWVGTWNKDSIYTLDALGNITSGFTIAGVRGPNNSGVRAFTYDGTYIYAALTRNAILRIDPASKTLVDSIVTPAAVRGLAYDSTANSGQGGFWISNFNSDFVLVSMTGTTLETITLGEHGVPSVYGIAFDPYTSGGPYIWAFGQGTSNPNDSAKLHRISVPTHLHTGVIHNVDADIAVPGAIAGSVSVTWRYNSTHFTLMGCTQNTTNNLFGYELSDYTPPAVDAACNSIDFFPPFLQLPTFEISPLSWDVNNSNNGTGPLNDVATTFVLDDGTTSVFTPADAHNFGATQGPPVVASFGSYVPPAVPQTYNATASVSTVGQTDQDNTNDLTTYSMAITDTVMARDNDTPTGSLGLPGGFAGILGQVFEIPLACSASSVTFRLRTPDIGDSISVDLYSFGTLPDVILASTSVYTIAGTDTDGAWITLPFNGGPVSIPSGTYFLGVNQYVTDSNITLATSTFNWRAESAYFQFAGGSWTAVEQNAGGPIPVCYLLRLNLQNTNNSVTEIGDQKFQVYPNPATSQLTVNPLNGRSEYMLELFDMPGHRVMETVSAAGSRSVLDVSTLAPGMYILKTTVEGNSTSIKLSIN